MDRLRNSSGTHVNVRSAHLLEVTLSTTLCVYEVESSKLWQLDTLGNIICQSGPTLSIESLSELLSLDLARPCVHSTELVTLT